MNSLGDRVKTARKYAKLTQVQLAKKVGTSQGAISDIENGRNKESSNLFDIAIATKVNPQWLIKNKGSMLDEEKKAAPSIEELRQKMRQIETKDAEQIMPEGTQRVSMTDLGEVPIISWVAAGSWSNVEPVTLDDVLGYAPRPANLSKNGFALIVRGRSMSPEFKPDDIIFVEPEAGLFSLKDGDLVVVSCNDDTEATFKQLILGDSPEEMYLKPLNPDWPEQKMLPMGECNLVGKVVGKYVVY